MKTLRVAVAVFFLFIFAGCGTSTSPAGVKNEDSTSTAIIYQKPLYAYPVKYTEWEIGRPEYVEKVINCYKAWDERDTVKLGSYFSDTVIIRLPAETTQIEIPNHKIARSLLANKSSYQSTSNNIISAVSLHDRESGEDWVMINTYNKWVEKNGNRDSMLLHEDWLIKDGKLKMLMSYTKTPTKTFLKNNDPMNK